MISWKEKITLLLLASCFLWIERARSNESRVYVDRSAAPKVDRSKMFKAKTFSQSDQQFDAKMIEKKALKLPKYSANLKSVPLTEWTPTHSDFYAKTLHLKDFEVKRAMEEWSKKMTLRAELSLREANSDFATKEAAIPSPQIETSKTEIRKTLEGEDLRRLINRGERGDVKVGRGLGAVDLGKESPPQNESK